MVNLAPGAKNFITDIVFHRCSRPFWVYLATALPAFVLADLTIRAIDPEDVMREQAEHVAHGPHKGTGRGGRHSIRSLLQDEGGERKHWSQKGLAHVLKWTEPLEAAGYGLLLWGAADHFFKNWETLLNQFHYCDDDARGPFERNLSGSSFFPNALLLPDLEQNRDNWPNNAAEVAVPPGRYFVALSAEGEYNGTSAGTWQAEIQCVGSLTGNLFLGDPTSVTGPGGVTCMVQCRPYFPAGGQIHWNVVGSGLPVGFSNANANVMVFEDKF